MEPKDFMLFQPPLPERHFAFAIDAGLKPKLFDVPPPLIGAARVTRVLNRLADAHDMPPDAVFDNHPTCARITRNSLSFARDPRDGEWSRRRPGRLKIQRSSRHSSRFDGFSARPHLRDSLARVQAYFINPRSIESPLAQIWRLV